MNRTPPIEVRRILRGEVGFGCPVPDCGNPYLEWHHFDPPWREREHHDPTGMVALCAEHHGKADAGAFTKAQLRAFKQSHPSIVSGRFDYLRHRMLGVVGGNFFYETPILVAYGQRPQIWWSRGENDYLRLSVRMVSISDEPRLTLDENDWIIRGNPTDFECPPSGKRIFARYSNGDVLGIEFFELSDSSAAEAKYPQTSRLSWKSLDFPITAVEIQNHVGGTGVGFGPLSSMLPGEGVFQGNFAVGSPVGLRW